MHATLRRLKRAPGRATEVASMIQAGALDGEVLLHTVPGGTARP